MINKNKLKTGAPYLDGLALERFDQYAELLVYWNERINLTSITGPDDIATKHFIDCLSILKYIDIPNGSSVIDVGTGAGFPGLVLLIARPDLQLTLLDSTEKKLNVIENILCELRLTAKLLHMRAEEAGRDTHYREKYDFATARAVAELTTLSEYCMPFVRQGGSFIAMKGAEAETELKNAKHSIEVLGGTVKPLHSFHLAGCGERTIFEIRKDRTTPAKYPRNPAQIKKKPL